MDATNFNADYVNGFSNAKAFIDHYKTLDNHSLSDGGMIAVYNELHVVQAPFVVDKDNYAITNECENV